MKKILVTVSEGFIVSHLVESLLQNNYSVKALVLYNSFNSLGWLKNIKHKNLEICLGDIRDHTFLSNIFNDIEIVFNLAALIGIPYSYVAPGSYIETNIKGTINLLDISLKKKIKHFIQVSTSEVYGTAQKIPIDERHPLVPQSPYSASKISSDSIALSYFFSFGLPVTIARPFNTFGPRQSSRAIIPTLINQCLFSDEILIGEIKTTRDFNYVLDMVRAFILILKNRKKIIGETLNIGTGNETSISDIIRILQSLVGVDLKVSLEKKRIRPKKSEVFRLCADRSKFRELVGWKPIYAGADGLERALAETIEWTRKNIDLKSYKNDKNYVI